MKLTKHQQKILNNLRKGGKINNVLGSYFWKHRRMLDTTIDAILATGETKEIKVVGKYMTSWYLVHKTYEE